MANNELDRQAADKRLAEERATAAAQGNPDAAGMPTTAGGQQPTPAANEGARDPNSVASASNKSFNVLRYPLNVGVGQQTHSLKIGIFTRNASPNKDVGIIPGNRFDARKGGKLVTPESTGTTAAGTAAATLITVGGKTMDALGNLAGNMAFMGAKSTVTTALAGASLAATAITNVGAMMAAVATSGLRLGGSNTSKEALGWINLYMPDTVNLVNNQNFDAVSMTEAMGVSGLLSQGSVDEMLLSFGETTGAVGERYRDAYMQKNLGYALNPQLEVLYSGPKNRSFIFEFRFTPRSSEEADQVWLIIQTLKFHAAPEYKDSTYSRYMIPPSEFGIEFLRGADINTSLPSIGPCVLTTIDIDYAPNSRYATFNDGMPVEIKMQLQFMETVILTKDNIKEGY